MIRILIVSLALLAVPFVVYFIYEIARAGPDGKGARNPKDWERDSVLNLGLAGLFLIFVGVVAVVATGDGSRDGTYTAARIENGKLIDGGFNKPESVPEAGATTE